MINLTVNHFKQILLGLILGLISVNVNAGKKENNHIFSTARLLFYQSVEDKGKIKPAIDLFQKISQQEKKYEGRVLTYVGALTALKGKHAFWPHTKLKLVKKGLTLMDQGIKKSPDDVEALFVHGSTCYYLPSFLRRGDDAQRDFKKIIRILPRQTNDYDFELLENVLKFIIEKAKLDADDREHIRQIRAQLPNK